MGSSVSLMVFQFVNNVHVTLGAGVLGIFLLARNGMNTHMFKTLTLATLTTASFCYTFATSPMLEASSEKVIIITGCDSGLGFSLAHHACDLGFTVFAGCLNINSDGANELSKMFDVKKMILIELDITNSNSVENVVTSVTTYLSVHKKSVLWALINNAGVMVFSEFEWQTERLIQQQLDVNLFGTMRITKAFIALLRNYSGRIINISSHCANATLPGLAVYGATKAGLTAWSDGLRIELGKYGIKVISFVPGSFIQQSNIMSRQNDNVFEMQSAMTSEQLNFYGDYFRQYHSYLSALSGVRVPKKIIDDKLYEVYENTLLEEQPQACYVHEPWRYTIYHTLFRISPVRLRDNLIVMFVQMPKWDREKRLCNIANVIA